MARLSPAARSGGPGGGVKGAGWNQTCYDAGAVQGENSHRATTVPVAGSPDRLQSLPPMKYIQSLTLLVAAVGLVSLSACSSKPASVPVMPDPGYTVPSK